MNKLENDSFISFSNDQAGVIFDDSNHEKYPMTFWNVVGNDIPTLNRNRTYYGYVYSGAFTLDAGGRVPICINKGYFFSINLDFDKFLNCVDGTEDKMIIIEVHHTRGIYPLTNYRGYNILGGPLEKSGRLKYIDGCTDSLLIPPVKLGDPCLNHLHFPSNIDQTPHTHPSHRIGMVTSGYGECITPFGNLPLAENMIFVIKEHDGVTEKKGLDGKMYPIGTHKFKTTNSTMNVIAFHPDSDFGATDINHPMINRTIVDGESANSIESIRTK